MSSNDDDAVEIDDDRLSGMVEDGAGEHVLEERYRAEVDEAAEGDRRRVADQGDAHLQIHAAKGSWRHRAVRAVRAPS